MTLRQAQRPHRIAAAFTAALSIALTATGCNVAPVYQRPEAPMAPTWQIEAPWREAAPNDAMLKGTWWEAFGDPVLDELERQALQGAQTLKLAAARLDQARSLVDLNASALLPNLQLQGAGNRSRISADRPLTNYASPTFATTQNDARLGFAVNYEIDLVGRIRNTIAVAQANAEQSAADYQNAKLLLTTDVAGNYYNLRALDSDLDVLQRGLDLQRRALEYTTNRHDLGASSGLDVAQQQALVDSTLTQLDLQRRQRSVYEHALAVLVGAPAPSFSVAPDVLKLPPPAIPIGIPSDLLERRPDVASAERAMASANAQIGIARAAFYPSLPLTATGGFEATSIANLIGASTLFWSLGAAVTQTVFDNGRARANVRFTQAGYDATVASYRQTVLVAMSEVENGITGLSALARSSVDAKSAVGSAERVLGLASDRYSGGLTTYLDVITAQQSLLNAQRQATQILGQQQLTSVLLVKALGGSWADRAPAPQARLEATDGKATATR